MERVIVVNFTGRTGGGPIVAYEMTKALLEIGKRLVVILSDGCSNIDLWKKLPLKQLIVLHTYQDGITLIKNSARFLLCADKRLERLSEEYEIDFIYCPMVSFWTRMINKKIGKNIRTCVVNHDPIPHSGERFYYPMKLFGIQRLYREADTIVVHSRRFVSYVEKRYRKEGRVLYIPLGRQSIIRELEHKAEPNFYDSDKVNFLFFGRIEAYKGIGILLDAYDMVLKCCRKVTLTIVGSGDCSKFDAQMRRLSVRLINRWIDDAEIGRYFCGENVVLVLPYLDATQSGAVLVALEYGIPSVCSDAGGLSEQVRDGETGVLVPAGNPGKLSEVMIKIAEQKTYRESLTRGIPKMLEELKWTSLAGTLISFMSTR